MPDRPTFKKDAITGEVIDLVEERYSNGFGTSSGFNWPVTAADAGRLADHFFAEVLPHFGPDEDAMADEEPDLFHSLLSASINLGHLDPLDLCRCLDRTVEHVLATGHSHHITRLMVLSNLATLLGVDPQALNHWFWIAYVDAYEWVVTPNVVGMGTFGDGGSIGTSSCGTGVVSRGTRGCRSRCPRCAGFRRHPSAITAVKPGPGGNGRGGPALMGLPDGARCHSVHVFEDQLQTAGQIPASPEGGKRGDHMDTIVMIIQVVIALGIYNVWLVRFGRSTNWRGGTAKNLKEEFAVYGLPGWAVWAVGFLKLLSATLLIVGIWFPALIKPAAVGMAVLMLGAVTMHFKVKDPPKRALPAFTMLVLSVIVAVAGGTAFPGSS